MCRYLQTVLCLLSCPDVWNTILLCLDVKAEGLGFSLNYDVVLSLACLNLQPASGEVGTPQENFYFFDVLIHTYIHNNRKMQSILFWSNIIFQEAVGDTLEELWISYNLIEKLKGLHVMKKLKILYMSNNLVKDWGKTELFLNKYIGNL